MGNAFHDAEIVQLGTNLRSKFGAKSSLVIGRIPEADLVVKDEACSRKQFLIRFDGNDFLLEAISDTNPTFCDGVRVVSPTRLTERTLIDAGTSRFRLLLPANLVPAPTVTPPRSEAISAPSAHIGHGATQISYDLPASVLVAAPIAITDGDRILGRDAGNTDVALRHPLVSRRHALLRGIYDGAVIKDLKSANGTFVNGKRIGVPVMLQPGDRVQIGPFAFAFTGRNLEPTRHVPTAEMVSAPKMQLATETEYRLVAHHVGVRVGQTSLLHDLSIGFRAGEFVTVLGPSGCGKSTLLRAMSGEIEPSEGRVIFEDCDLYRAPAGAMQRIAVVPQREILPTVLNVSDALRYTAALRLPPDTPAVELDRHVVEVLALVGLTEKQHVPIERLSGGEVKRVGLANELLAEPGLVFLDEVTSGLDEQSDQEMMGLFRQLANNGKTVIAVTHTLAHVAKYCHRVVILARDGRLAFVGTPTEALTYFEIDRLGDVYEKLNEREPDGWADRFRNSPDSPNLPPAPPIPPNATIGLPTETIAALKHQTPILARRTTRVLLADVSAISVTLGQAALIAILMVWVFGNLQNPGNPLERARASRSVLFVLAVTSFWLGCNTAAKEIVREWALLRKERQANLSLASYLLGKWCVLAALTFGQVLLLTGLVSYGCELPGSLLLQLFVFTVIGWAGVSAGLLISAIAKTEAVAVALVPVIVIPQLILSDLFQPLRGWVKTFADWLITVHTGFNGVLSCLPAGDRAIVAPSGTSAGAAILWLLAQTAILGYVTWYVLVTRCQSSRVSLLPAFRRRLGVNR